MEGCNPIAVLWRCRHPACFARIAAWPIARLLRLDMQGEPIHRANTDTGTALDSTLRAGLPCLAPKPDPAPGCTGLDHHCAQSKEGAGSDLGRLSLRPPNAVQDRDDLPHHRGSEPDTVPWMRKQQEQNEPD